MKWSLKRLLSFVHYFVDKNEIIILKRWTEMIFVLLQFQLFENSSKGSAHDKTLKISCKNEKLVKNIGKVIYGHSECGDACSVGDSNCRYS